MSGAELQDLDRYQRQLMALTPSPAERQDITKLPWYTIILRLSVLAGLMMGRHDEVGRALARYAGAMAEVLEHLDTGAAAWSRVRGPQDLQRFRSAVEASSDFAREVGWMLLSLGESHRFGDYRQVATSICAEESAVASAAVRTFMARLGDVPSWPRLGLDGAPTVLCGPGEASAFLCYQPPRVADRLPERVYKEGLGDQGIPAVDRGPAPRAPQAGRGRVTSEEPSGGSMSLLSQLVPLQQVTTAVPRLLGPFADVPLVRRLLTELAVRRLAGATPPRPRPFTLAADYTCWPSLTDRSFTGRHLPPAVPGSVRRPAVADVLELFRRPAGGEVPSTDTSVLFMFFAQWFTDSFLRTDRSDPRRNTSTQEIDFCQIYGLSEAKTRLLRDSRGGRLKSQRIGGEEYPPFLLERREHGWQVKPEFDGLHDEAFLLDVLLAGVPERQKELFFAVGLEHGNSTVGNTCLDIVFLREHNRIAGLLERQYRDGVESPSWDRDLSDEELDERLFQTTRNIMIVLLLKLVVEQYIRHIAPGDVPLTLVPGMAEGRRWKASNWVAVEFNLLYRWHSMVPETIWTESGPVPAKDFSRDNNEVVLERGLEWVLRQCSRSRAGKVTLGNTPSFLIDRHTLDRPAVEERTIALMRYARLASYNDYRERFGLARLRSFAELTADEPLRRKLTELYGDIDALEWYVGIFAEDHPEDGFLGSLLTMMVGHDAFTQVLTNPLLGPQVYNASTFTAAGLELIEQTRSLQDIVERNAADPGGVLASFPWRPAANGQDLASSSSSVGRLLVPGPRAPRSAGAGTTAGAADPRPPA